MSKKRKNHKNRNVLRKMDERLSKVSQEQAILNDLITCSSVCSNLNPVTARKTYDTVEEIDELIAQLPGVDYVVKRLIYYIFSNGMTTGTRPIDEKTLDPWLYEEQNESGSTNYDALKTAIEGAVIYGEYGLRMYDGNLYPVKKGKYALLTNEHDGVVSVLGFIIRADGKSITKDIDTTDWEEFEDWDDVTNYFIENNLILLDPTEFVNLRNETSELHGISPFTQDQERIDLLLSVYERLNYDINYDGPGRIIVRPKDNITDNDVSTGQILNNSLPAQEERNRKAKEEIARVGNEIKQSSSDSVILLSNAFSDKVEHLPRVTKATEFFDWIVNDTVIIAQILGMSPTLLEVGKLHGNISVEKIIDNAMLNTIIPMRETYAVQFSKMIAKRLGVNKIYFDKYDMQQVQDENAERGKVAETIKALSVASKNYESDNLNNLIEQFTDFLRTSIMDDYGKTRTL